MAGRKTIEAKVVEWFETADVATARVVLGIVAGKVRERERSARATTGTSTLKRPERPQVKPIIELSHVQVANAAD